MKRILVVSSPSIAHEICARPGWSHRFDEVLCSSLHEVMRRYHAVLPIEPGALPSFISTDVRVALLCTEVNAFERIESTKPNADLLFAPSAVARLDLSVATRLTLKTARALTRGETIALDDLVTEPGGRGLGENLKKRVIGRGVVYDLPKDAPIDFGVLEAAGGRS